jgi:hypothetical protein
VTGPLPGAVAAPATPEPGPTPTPQAANAPDAGPTSSPEAPQDDSTDPASEQSGADTSVDALAGGATRSADASRSHEGPPAADDGSRGDSTPASAAAVTDPVTAAHTPGMGPPVPAPRPEAGRHVTGREDSAADKQGRPADLVTQRQDSSTRPNRTRHDRSTGPRGRPGKIGHSGVARDTGDLQPAAIAHTPNPLTADEETGAITASHGDSGPRHDEPESHKDGGDDTNGHNTPEPDTAGGGAGDYRAGGGGGGGGVGQGGAGPGDGSDGQGDSAQGSDGGAEALEEIDADDPNATNFVENDRDPKPVAGSPTGSGESGAEAEEAGNDATAGGGVRAEEAGNDATAGGGVRAEEALAHRPAETATSSGESGPSQSTGAEGELADRLTSQYGAGTVPVDAAALTTDQLQKRANIAANQLNSTEGRTEGLDVEALADDSHIVPVGADETDDFSDFRTWLREQRESPGRGRPQLSDLDRRRLVDIALGHDPQPVAPVKRIELCIDGFEEGEWGPFVWMQKMFGGRLLGGPDSPSVEQGWTPDNQNRSISRSAAVQDGPTSSSAAIADSSTREEGDPDDGGREVSGALGSDRERPEPAGGLAPVVEHRPLRLADFGEWDGYGTCAGIAAALQDKLNTAVDIDMPDSAIDAAREMAKVLDYVFGAIGRVGGVTRILVGDPRQTLIKANVAGEHAETITFALAKDESRGGQFLILNHRLADPQWARRAQWPIHPMAAAAFGDRPVLTSTLYAACHALIAGLAEYAKDRELRWFADRVLRECHARSDGRFDEDEYLSWRDRTVPDGRQGGARWDWTKAAALACGTASQGQRVLYELLVEEAQAAAARAALLGQGGPASVDRHGHVDLGACQSLSQVTKQISKLGIKPVGFNRAGLNLELVKGFFQTLADLVDVLPEARPLRAGVDDTRGADAIGIGASTHYDVKPDGTLFTDKIAVEVRMAADDPAHVRDVTERDWVSGHSRTRADDPMGGTAAHEAAHALVFAGNNRAVDKAAVALRRFYVCKYGSFEGYERWERLGLSAYSYDFGFRPTEAVPEGFSSVWHRGQEASEAELVLDCSVHRQPVVDRP